MAAESKLLQTVQEQGSCNTLLESAGAGDI